MAGRVSSATGDLSGVAGIEAAETKESTLERTGETVCSDTTWGAMGDEEAEGDKRVWCMLVFLQQHRVH